MKRNNQWKDVEIQFGIEVGCQGDESGAWCDTGGLVLPVAIVDELRTLFPEEFRNVSDGGCYLDFDVRGEGFYDSGDRDTPPCHADMRDVVGITAYPAIPWTKDTGGYAKEGKPLSKEAVAILAKEYAEEIDEADMPEWEGP